MRWNDNTRGIRIQVYGLLLGAWAASPIAAQPSVAAADAELLAAQLRGQGFQCESPVAAERDGALSRPDEAAWTITCANASYRVRLIPDQAAVVQRLD